MGGLCSWFSPKAKSGSRGRPVAADKPSSGLLSSMADMGRLADALEKDEGADRGDDEEEERNGSAFIGKTKVGRGDGRFGLVIRGFSTSVAAVACDDRISFLDSSCAYDGILNSTGSRFGVREGGLCVERNDMLPVASCVEIVVILSVPPAGQGAFCNEDYIMKRIVVVGYEADWSRISIVGFCGNWRG